MENFTPYTALIGGALIGLAATVLLLMNGRIAGVSGILNGIFKSSCGDVAWRVWFLIGLIIGGGLYIMFFPPAFEPRSGFPLALLVIAGVLVGFGARLGSGCTSGHGVCGLARLSGRSLVATGVFLTTGMLTVFFVTRHVSGV